MTTSDVFEIKDQYPEIGFALLPTEMKLALPVLYKTEKNILYDLR